MSASFSGHSDITYTMIWHGVSACVGLAIGKIHDLIGQIKDDQRALKIEMEESVYVKNRRLVKGKKQTKENSIEKTENSNSEKILNSNSEKILDDNSEKIFDSDSEKISV